MKKIIVSIVLFGAFASCHAQQHDTSANTLKAIQQIPAFKIFIAPDSVAFSNEELIKNKPVVLMFFNPDCEHCQRETKELIAYKEELKDIQFVMVSALPFKLIKEFYTDYNIAAMPNIKMGQDPTFSLGTKYRPTRYPAIFVYDTNGKLAKVFAGNAGVPAIIAATK